MTERPDVVLHLSHDAAIVMAEVLADNFYAGRGPLAERLTRVQTVAFSELLFCLEKNQSVSPIGLESRFVDELSLASRRIDAMNWPDDPE